MAEWGLRTPGVIRLVMLHFLFQLPSINTLCEKNHVIRLVSLLRPGVAPTATHTRVWRWKDAVLGDGQDMFIPKPATTRKMSQLVVHLGAGAISEAVVVSNCKRMEVLVACEATFEESELANVISNLLCFQTSAWNARSADTGMESLTAFLDKPDVLVWPDANSDSFCLNMFESRRIFELLKVLSGTEAVTRYLSLVAAGLPVERELKTFAPFSSRDAHILLQLKRILDATSQQGSGPPPCRYRLGIVMRSVLAAGKAARDTTIVPELESSRPSKFPSLRTAEANARVALAKGIEPCVARCTAEINALEHSEVIANLRRRAEIAAGAAVGASGQSPETWKIAVNQELHSPTAEIRAGRQVDEDLVIERAVAAALASASGL